MKIIRWLSFASLAVALGLLVAGLSDIAAFLLGAATVVEMVGSAIIGKKTNDGMR